MGPTVIALLYFGLCMSQEIKSLAGIFLRPILEVDSGPLIPQGTPVTLRCKGHPEATWYGLKKGKSQFQDMLGTGKEASFLISSMSKANAGSYCCFYKSHSGSSRPSEPLKLVLTGLYSKPSLSATPSQEVALGQNVTLHCQTEQRFDRFVFYKEGGTNISQLQNSLSQPDLLIPNVTAADGGIYRCYVFHSQHPFLCSTLSDPLELRVTVPGTSDPGLEPPDLLFGLPRLQAGILIGISTLPILLFLIFFLFFLLQPYHHRARLRTADKEAGVEETLRSQAKDAPPESLYVSVEHVQMDEHRKPNALEAKDSQEVIYAHLIHKTPSQHLECLPPFPPGESILYTPLAIQMTSCCLVHKGKTGFSSCSKEWGWRPSFIFGYLSQSACLNSNLSSFSPEPGTIMPPLVITLLGFGLWLSQWIRAQDGTLPRPTLQADPGPLIPQKKSVTLRCQGFPGADKYRLRKEGSSQDTDGREAEFYISSVTLNTTGSYHCLYQHQSQWSKPSEPLALVMTGWYDKPSLSALPSPEVILGENVTLQCRSQSWFEKYALHKEGEASPSQSQGSWYHANFHIPEVTTAHRGSYRCYGFHSDTPYEWSDPSDPLELRVRGTTEDPQISTKAWKSTDSLTDTSPQNYTVGNLIRLSLAGLVLIILGVVLMEAWFSQRRHRKTGQKPWLEQPHQAKEQDKVGNQ
ncbi:leukocyte immunoglobulin-like receptor subfamily A member 2 [Macrotis lagotis]|uniref:leukocyte immunoglobulin-like receptor subfamily A member 2 n=1 Tax=Macrotis lagotis TaxID=92651 RepID=UPI003D692D89